MTALGTVRIIVGPARRTLTLSAEFWRRAGRKFLRRVGEAGVETARQECPVRTGRLRDSIRYTISLVHPPTVTIEATAMKPDKGIRYGIFVERGTAPSPGRYVPAIGKRLVRPSRRNPRVGEHPGTPANPFMFRTLLDLEHRAIPSIIQELISEFRGRV